jgi:hypothetical protein
MVMHDQDLVSLEELRAVLNFYAGPDMPRKRPARLGLRRSRRIVLAGIAAVAVVGVGTAIAATGWLVGAAAPQTVVTNLGSHDSELGSKPNAQGSVLVASDGAINLYAATASDGGYCWLVSSPWNPATTNEGGNCYSAATLSKPLVAFAGGASPISADGFTAIVVGRAASPDAQSVSFTAPDGSTVSRPIGSSGFFVAAFHLAGTPCDYPNNWKSTITALNAHGAVVAQTMQTHLIATCVHHIEP